MVDRYRMKTENYHDTRMHKRNTGEWVKYEDYAELEAENARLRQQRDSANAQLDFILGNLNNESK